MKTCSFVLFLLWVNTLTAQSQTIEHLNIDSLVASHLGEYSMQTGNALVVSDSTTSAVVFFEKLFLDSINHEKDSSDFLVFTELLRPRPSASVFQLLYFDEESNSIQKRTVDTLDINLGGSTCHFTAVVDSAAVVSRGNSTYLVLLMCHPVFYSCNSVTYFYTKSYTLSRFSDKLHFSDGSTPEIGLYIHESNWREKAFRDFAKP
ncbi:MAG: hypothetical protein AB8B56_13465 [Crocinitomicaceae bacterium]